MKVLVNGGLNLSELDGWWAEAYSPDVGWAIGDGNEHGEDPGWDRTEADALYSLLERDVIPQFYNRDAQGIPRAWVAKMRESMARLTPQFSANRTVRQYAEEHYLPAAAAYCQRADAGGKLASDLLEWQRAIAMHWGRIRFGAIKIFTHDDHHVFEVQVYLDELDPEAVLVELYADPQDGGDPFRRPMMRGEPLAGSTGGYAYGAQVPASRPAGNYTARVIPFKAGAFVPLEAAQIIWQR
jgi:starch phosphorylase